MKEIEIPGFGHGEIIPSINAHGSSEPGEPRVFTNEEINRTPIFIHRKPQKEGAEKSFGSIGYVLALLGADPGMAVQQENGKIKMEKITPEQATDTVIEWETRNKRIFTYTQDCSLVNSAQENPEAYGLKKGQMNTVMRHIGNKLYNEEMIAEVSMLIRDKNNTKKVGVGIVLTDEKNPKTIRPAKINGNEIFIYDATLHMKSLESLAVFAQKKGIHVKGGDLKTKAGMQMDAAFGLQAVELKKEMPVFQIDLRGKTPQVAQKGMYGGRNSF